MTPSPASPRLHVLFICAMNQCRSLTAEHLWRNDARLEVRSAGLRSEARRRVSEADLTWADVVFVMEREHKTRLLSQFSHLALPPIEILEIPDDFTHMQPELIEILRMNVEPELKCFLGSEG